MPYKQKSPFNSFRDPKRAVKNFKPTEFKMPDLSPIVNKTADGTDMTDDRKTDDSGGEKKNGMLSSENAAMKEINSNKQAIAEKQKPEHIKIRERYAEDKAKEKAAFKQIRKNARLADKKTTAEEKDRFNKDKIRMQESKFDKSKAGKESQEQQDVKNDIGDMRSKYNVGGRINSKPDNSLLKMEPEGGDMTLGGIENFKKENEIAKLKAAKGGDMRAIRDQRFVNSIDEIGGGFETPTLNQGNGNPNTPTANKASQKMNFQGYMNNPLNMQSRSKMEKSGETVKPGSISCGRGSFKIQSPLSVTATGLATNRGSQTTGLGPAQPPPPPPPPPGSGTSSAAGAGNVNAGGNTTTIGMGATLDSGADPNGYVNPYNQPGYQHGGGVSSSTGTGGGTGTGTTGTGVTSGSGASNSGMMGNQSGQTGFGNPGSGGTWFGGTGSGGADPANSGGTNTVNTLGTGYLNSGTGGNNTNTSGPGATGSVGSGMGGTNSGTYYNNANPGAGTHLGGSGIGAGQGSGSGGSTTNSTATTTPTPPVTGYADANASGYSTREAQFLNQAMPMFSTMKSMGPNKALQGDQDNLPKHLKQAIINSPGMYDKSPLSKNIDFSSLKKGALREELNIPKGEKIPLSDLKTKPGDSKKTKQRKNLAKTMRSFKK